MNLHYYCSRSGRNLIFEYIDQLSVEEQVVHACRKQTNKTEKNDKQVVESRTKELGKELGKPFI